MKIKRLWRSVKLVCVDRRATEVVQSLSTRMRRRLNRRSILSRRLEIDGEAPVFEQTPARGPASWGCL